MKSKKLEKTLSLMKELSDSQPTGYSLFVAGVGNLFLCKGFGGKREVIGEVSFPGGLDGGDPDVTEEDGIRYIYL